MSKLCQCPFCKIDITISNDPYESNIYCASCERYHHYIYCDHCNDILCLFGKRRSCNLVHGELKYRNCSKCNSWKLFNTNIINDHNILMFCSCGNPINDPDKFSTEFEHEFEHGLKKFEVSIDNFLKRSEQIIKLSADVIINQELDEKSKPNLAMEIAAASLDQIDKIVSNGYKENQLLPIDRPIKTNNRVHHGKIYATLEEFYKGCENSYTFGEKKYDIVIPPGLKSGTKFTFENQVLGKYINNVYDVVVTIAQSTHKDFIRENDNIIYNCDISELNPNKKYKVTIPHLDGELICVTLDKTLFSIRNFVILDRGFTNRKTKEKGHLVVKLI
jgi:hypothetical protein